MFRIRGERQLTMRHGLPDKLSQRNLGTHQGIEPKALDYLSGALPVERSRLANKQL